jgi:hypothetical protein
MIVDLMGISLPFGIEMIKHSERTVHPEKCPSCGTGTKKRVGESLGCPKEISAELWAL